MIGDASVEGPVDASRCHRVNGVDNYLARHSARPRLRMLRRVAAADSGAPLTPPGQMGLVTSSLISVGPFAVKPQVIIRIFIFILILILGLILIRVLVFIRVLIRIFLWALTCHNHVFLESGGHFQPTCAPFTSHSAICEASLPEERISRI